MNDSIGHIFLSFNSRDRELVSKITNNLSLETPRLWQDSKAIDKRFNWVPQLNEGLTNAYAYVIFFGRHGYGAIQRSEVDFIKRRISMENVPCVYIGLPGAASDQSSDFHKLTCKIQFGFPEDKHAISSYKRCLAWIINKNA